MARARQLIVDIEGLFSVIMPLTGVAFLLFALATKLTYDDLRTRNLEHFMAIRKMDVLDGVITRLQRAEEALTTWVREDDDDGTDWHHADPRESARHLIKSRKRLKKALDGDQEAGRAYRELQLLHDELMEVNRHHGEYRYESFKGRIVTVRKGCQTWFSQLAAGLPKGVLTERKRLRKQCTTTLTWGIFLLAFGALCFVEWRGDVKERRDIKKSLEWDVYDEPERPHQSGHGGL